VSHHKFDACFKELVPQRVDLFTLGEVTRIPRHNIWSCLGHEAVKGKNGDSAGSEKSQGLHHPLFEERTKAPHFVVRGRSHRKAGAESGQADKVAKLTMTHSSSGSTAPPVTFKVSVM
jgi:hypothetical protein